MAQAHYFVPSRARWPIVGSFGLFVMVMGTATWFNNPAIGPWILLTGAAIVAVMFFGWFSEVIGESERGVYNKAVDGSFRQGMIWFIFTEIMLFGSFFGALFYTRILSVPWVGGEGTGAMTNQLLYPEYDAAWPTAGPANLGGGFELIPAFGLPLVNTLLLLSSGLTITLAHWALKKAQRGPLVGWMIATVALGSTFLYFQATEYVHAYQDLGLTLGSGIYGSTFFMLTGLHGVHVTAGTIMLIVITLRCMAGHFTKKNHFGFEAVAWYWHFVDVVWLGLFVFVYVL